MPDQDARLLFASHFEVGAIYGQQIAASSAFSLFALANSMPSYLRRQLEDVASLIPC